MQITLDQSQQEMWAGQAAQCSDLGMLLSAPLLAPSVICGFPVQSDSLMIDAGNRF